MKLLKYRTTGTLTDTIERENVALAQDYLTSDDMTQYLDDGLELVVGHIRWHLNSDGHTYYVEALAVRELTADELKALASWVSGQNSDGLGEGFEQQDFAETGEYDAYGDRDADTYGMISFDWETNDSAFTRVD